MRAARIHAFGDPSGLSVDDVTTPEPGAGEVRVVVAGATVNRTDINLRQGLYGGVTPGTEGVPLGMDVSGTVDAVGPGVTSVAVSDPVIGFAGPPNTPSAQAEYLVLPAGSLSSAPVSVSLPRAATLPLNGLTAIQALREAELSASSTVVVTGAAGGLGMLLVQIARHAGHHVIAWVRDAGDFDYVRRLGAVETVTAADQIAPGSVAAVIDAATIVQPTIASIEDGGRYVNFRGATPALERGIRKLDIGVRSDQAQLRELVELVDAGSLQLPGIEAWPLPQVAAAQERFEAGRVRDRLVLVP